MFYTIAAMGCMYAAVHEHTAPTLACALKPTRICAVAGAELRHLCDESALAAAQRCEPQAFEIEQSDFNSMLRHMTPALSQSELDEYAAWGKPDGRSYVS